MDRLEAEFDAVLNLLDRQVIDKDGLLVCKVDDVQLREEDDVGLWVHGLLAGPAALLPRFSGRPGRSLLEQWRRLGLQQGDRTVPWFLDLELVERVTTSVHLRVPREGILRIPDRDDDTAYHRLDDLLGLPVLREPEGEHLGHVVDLRFAPHQESRGFACTHLVVGRGRPGSMLGYDRGGHRGPALLSHLIRWMHRHTGQVSADRIRSIDWEQGVVRVEAGLAPLTRAGVTRSPSG